MPGWRRPAARASRLRDYRLPAVALPENRTHDQPAVNYGVTGGGIFVICTLTIFQAPFVRT